LRAAAHPPGLPHNVNRPTVGILLQRQNAIPLGIFFHQNRCRNTFDCIRREDIVFPKFDIAMFGYPYVIT